MRTPNENLKAILRDQAHLPCAVQLAVEINASSGSRDCRDDVMPLQQRVFSTSNNVDTDSWNSAGLDSQATTRALREISVGVENNPIGLSSISFVDKTITLELGS